MKARADPGFLTALIDDGRPLITLTAVALLLSGSFAIFLAARREFLPHDIAYLQMSAEQLCGLAQCRIVRFMFHDRVAFGGTLISIAAGMPRRAGRFRRRRRWRVWRGSDARSESTTSRATLTSSTWRQRLSVLRSSS